jgi:hypothetical protein
MNKTKIEWCPNLVLTALSPTAIPAIQSGEQFVMAVRASDFYALATERDEAVRLLREANGCLLEGTAIDGDISAFLAALDAMKEG